MGATVVFRLGMDSWRVSWSSRFGARRLSTTLLFSVFELGFFFNIPPPPHDISTLRSVFRTRYFDLCTIFLLMKRSFAAIVVVSHLLNPYGPLSVFMHHTTLNGNVRTVY